MRRRTSSLAATQFLEIFSMAGGIGLFVDAKDHDAKAFYKHFGFVPLPSNELQLFLPVATIQEALATGADAAEEAVAISWAVAPFDFFEI